MAETLFDGLPQRFRDAALAALLEARRTRPSGWPVPEIIERTAAGWQVPPEMLGAFFGLLKYRAPVQGRPWAWLDVFRGTHPGRPGGPPAMSGDARAMYDCFRAYTGLLGGWFPPLPTVH